MSRDRAVELYVAAKKRAEGALEMAKAALVDPDRDLRAAAAFALDLLGDASAMDALVAALEDPSFGVRSNAGWALVHLAEGGHAERVIAAMSAVVAGTRHDGAREMAHLVLFHVYGAARSRRAAT